MNTSATFITAHRPPPVVGSSNLSAVQPRSSRIKPLITPREHQILYLIAYEHSTKEIAAKLFISFETVNTHRKNIMVKLDVKNTAGMVRVAFERNILLT